jgi:hypothetical protein
MQANDQPALITEYKIAGGNTHKDFAAIPGIKEQQLQRYKTRPILAVLVSITCSLLLKR